MEQLVWAVIIIVFIIYTALKKRARNRPSTNIDRTADTEQKTGGKDDRLGRYMEELLGIKRPETKPQIRIKRETQKPLEEMVTQGEAPEAKKRVDSFESPLMKEHGLEQKPPLPEARKVHHARFPWGNLSREDLPNAIILSEIIGPPISKRKSHRLF
ncbi:MAG: hypothetical protein ACUZ9M_10535 [Candidatus Scalindua sp.]